MKMMITHTAVSMVFFGLLSAALALALQYTVFSLLPASYWVEYHSVEATQDEFFAGDDLTFSSQRTVTRPPIDVTWYDTLYCRTDAEKEYTDYSQYTTGTLMEEANTKTGEWVYNARHPRNAECFLKTRVKSVISFGIVKSQVLYSQPFQIKK